MHECKLVSAMMGKKDECSRSQESEEQKRTRWKATPNYTDLEKREEDLNKFFRKQHTDVIQKAVNLPLEKYAQIMDDFYSTGGDLAPRINSLISRLQSA